MRAIALAALISACSLASTAGSASTPSPSPTLTRQPLPSLTCARTLTRDVSGVVTANGVFGILGDTTASSGAVNDFFVMVMRGATLSQHLTVVFINVGSHGPAQSVSYGVIAERMPNAWGELMFKLYVKPIGFANSCWQIKTDAGDTGLVLEIGS